MREKLKFAQELTTMKLNMEKFKQQKKNIIHDEILIFIFFFCFHNHEILSSLFTFISSELNWTSSSNSTPVGVYQHHVDCFSAFASSFVY